MRSVSLPVVLVAVLVQLSDAWDVLSALKRHHLHKKQVRKHEKAASNAQTGVTSASTPPDINYRDINGLSYQASKKLCKNAGKRICELREYCPATTGGKVVQPIRGTQKGDRWAPIGDSFNQWIQLGTEYPDRLCKTHSNCCGSKPGWGLPQNEIKMQQILLCCDGPSSLKVCCGFQFFPNVTIHCL